VSAGQRCTVGKERATLMGNTVTTVDGLMDLIGHKLGTSEWLEVTQERVNTFADATDDHQWIHTDPEKAASGPFGRPIAHGYLTLSLVIPLFWQVLTLTDASMAVNYGLNKVRFPAPVPVGAKIRLEATLSAVEHVGDAVQVTVDCVFEIDSGSKPACVAQAIYRLYS
jgi:acyl dehydratase